MFCDRCGQLYLPKQSLCTRCKVVPTRYWFQLMSLATLLLAIVCNTLVAMYLLPRMTSVPHPRLIFRAWLWLDHGMALYGWVPLAIALLAWDYFVWKAARPKVKGWFTRKLLTLALATGVAPILPWWIPAGQPPKEFLSLLNRYPGMPAALAWGVALVVAMILCSDRESRDYLLGHGRVLSVVSFGILLLVLAMTVVGWRLST